MLVFLILSGTAGYRIIESWSVLDSLYMTIITISTVGYGEIQSLTPAGRIFTMGLIICSLGIAGFGLSAIGAFILEGQINRFLKVRKMDREIAKLKNHIIVCGGGPTGKRIVQEFIHTKSSFILIDQNDDVLRHLDHLGQFPFLRGDATEDETLLDAGIDRATGLVAALSDDKDNVFVVLTAKSLNPGIKVVARLVEESNTQKLRKAGADEIISPNAIGGLRMASVMIRPSTVNFLDSMLRSSGSEAFRIHDFSLKDFSHLHGKTLATLDISRKTGLLVLAVMNGEGEFLFNPTGETQLAPADTLIVTGTRSMISKLTDIKATNV